MQLPRGRFHRLIKSTTTRALIDECLAERFTGICTILGSETVTLVLNDGEVVLAEYGGIKKQHALDAALKGEENEVAAELNLLTPDQIRLALEFNPLFTIETPERSGRPSTGKSAPERAAPPTTPKSIGVVSSSRRRPKPVAEVHHIPMPGVKPEQEKAEAPQSGGDEIDELVQNMEEMDVEQLVGNFKQNCRDMLKKIHLDHLIKDKET